MGENRMTNINEFAERYPHLVNGEPFTTSDGVRLRISPGTKAAGDYVLDIDSAGAWRRLKFETLGVLVEFLYRNEDLLFPPRRLGGRFDGGEKVFRYMRECLKHGHPIAARNLEIEKRDKQAQAQLFDDLRFGDEGEAA
jgi:hypothetical protein